MACLLEKIHLLEHQALHNWQVQSGLVIAITVLTLQRFSSALSCEEASPHSCKTRCPLGAAGVQVVVPRGCPLRLGRRFGGCAGEHGAGAQQAIPWIRGEQ